MALSPLYFVTADLEELFRDKDTGLPLANGILTFYRDSARTILKPIYQLTGAPPYGPGSYVQLPNPLTLSAVGTVQNAGGDNEVIYYYPWIIDISGNLVQDLYYVVGTDSAGTEQFTREAWPPNTGSAVSPSTSISNFTENQIANPTFTNILISDGVSSTYTVAGPTQTFQFAPDWDFVITGTGTVTVQRFAVAGASHVPSSPPYVIDVSVPIGITQCFLRQRLPYNSGLWASTASQSIFLSGSFVARNEAGGTTSLQLYYDHSGISSPTLVVDATTVTTSFQSFSGGTAASIPLSGDVNTGQSGYVDVYLSFTQSSHVRVSCVQLIPSLTAFDAVTNPVAPDLNSSNRDEAFQGDYYIPRLNKKNIHSFLVGWDFTVSPFQFGTAPTTVPAAPAYIVDQTIAQAIGAGTLSYFRDNQTNGLRMTSAAGANAVYIMQYLSGNQVNDMLGTSMSVNVFGYRQSGASCTMKVYLFRAASATAIPTLPASLGVLAIDGTFTLTAAGWTEIPRNGANPATNWPTAQASLNLVPVGTESNINNGTNDFGFSGWQITDSTQLSDTNKFAIVVTFVPAASTSFTVNSISVVPGDIPCRPAIQTADEVLRECQYYYEKSYNPATQPGAVSIFGLQVLSLPVFTSGGGPTDSVGLKSFQLNFKTVKRLATAPAITNIVFYSADGTADKIQVGIAIVGGATTLINVTASIGWSRTNQTIYGFSMLAFNTGAVVSGIPTTINNQGLLQYHYVMDVRLGVI